MEKEGSTRWTYLCRSFDPSPCFMFSSSKSHTSSYSIRFMFRSEAFIDLFARMGLQKGNCSLHYLRIDLIISTH